MNAPRQECQNIPKCLSFSSNRLKCNTDKTLFLACACGELHNVYDLIVGKDERYTHLLTDKVNGWTSLHYSVHYGQLLVVCYLIRIGLALSYLDHEDVSPLDLLIINEQHIISSFADFDDGGITEDKHDCNLHLDGEAGGINENCNEIVDNIFVDDDNFRNLPTSCVYKTQDEVTHYIPVNDHFRLKLVYYLNTHPDCKDVYVNPVYSWGSNANFTLGHPSDKSRSHPTPIEFFNHCSIYMKQIVMNKYHSVFLSYCGKVYTCGHGQGGRLGHSKGMTSVVPQRIAVSGISQVVASVDHTMLLTRRGEIYGFGKNNHYQLGFTSLGKECWSPRLLNVLWWGKTKVKYLATSKYHTVISTTDGVYTFGLNAGHLGHIKGEKYIQKARKVAGLRKDLIPFQVSCSSSSTVCLGQNGLCFIFQGYSHKRLFQVNEVIVKLVVSGGHLDVSVDPGLLKEELYENVTIFMLDENGVLSIWRENTPVYKKCELKLKRNDKIRDFAFSCNSLLLVMTDGVVFKGFLPPEDLQDNVSMMIKVEVIPQISFANVAAIDDRAANYMIGQLYTERYKLNLEGDLPAEHTSSLCDLDTYYADLQYREGFSDLVFQVSNKLFPVDKYIIFSRCQYLHQMVLHHELTSDKDISASPLTVTVSHIKPDVFEQILQFLYKNNCDWLIDYCNDMNNSTMPTCDSLKSTNRSLLSTDNGQHRKLSHLVNENEHYDYSNFDLLKQLLKTSRLFLLEELSSRLENLLSHINDCRPETSRLNNSYSKNIQFDRYKFPELCDVRLISDSGAVRSCHRCVLVARAEYFYCMFSNQWIENNQRPSVKLPLHTSVLDSLLDYIYTSKSDIVQDCVDVPMLCKVLAAADQFCLPSLKFMAELKLVALTTVKNVAELFCLSNLYGCERLRHTCMLFVCLHLPVIFEARTLDILNEEDLRELSAFYKKLVPGLETRLYPPYSHGAAQMSISELTPTFNDDIASSSDHLPLGPKGGKSPRRRTKSAENFSNNKLINVKDDIPHGEKLCHSDVLDIANVSVGCHGDSVSGLQEGSFWNTYPGAPKLREIIEEEKHLQNCAPRTKSYLPSSTSTFLERSPSHPLMVSMRDLIIESKKHRDKPHRVADELHKTPKTWVTPDSELGTPISLMTVIEEEKKKVHCLRRDLNKSFSLIQIEEQAMEELRAFYDSRNQFDFRVTVERAFSMTHEAVTWPKKL